VRCRVSRIALLIEGDSDKTRTVGVSRTQVTPQVAKIEVGRGGIEPPTRGFSVKPGTSAASVIVDHSRACHPGGSRLVDGDRHTIRTVIRTVPGGTCEPPGVPCVPGQPAPFRRGAPALLGSRQTCVAEGVTVPGPWLSKFGADVRASDTAGEGQRHPARAEPTPPVATRGTRPEPPAARRSSMRDVASTAPKWRSSASPGPRGHSG